ncbi:cinnamoyl-CoA reductase [Apiospora kogelbergensis]|uniref:cinnamoyl-CoA reductase n=1 Tax=Apiospora kogelbergensis TaxID=1337665 RepID=UPI00312EC6B4
MGPAILLTGANGLVGFKVLLNALEQGYTVRAAIRSMSKSDVPDITDQKAYHEATKGSYLCHSSGLASSLPSAGPPQTGIYEPNKLVIASSFFANIPFPPNGGKITAESRLPDIPGPFDSMVPAYSAGKIAALNAAERFVKENSPTFDDVNVFPGFVFGTDDRALQVEDIMVSTNRILLGVITGQVAPGAGYVYDAVKLFLHALDVIAPKNIGATVPHQFNEAWDIVKERFPKAAKNGTFTQGKQETIPIGWDAHQTELDFGFKVKIWSDMVVDVAGLYLELPGKF